MWKSFIFGSVLTFAVSAGSTRTSLAQMQPGILVPIQEQNSVLTPPGAQMQPGILVPIQDQNPGPALPGQLAGWRPPTSTPTLWTGPGQAGSPASIPNIKIDERSLREAVQILDTFGGIFVEPLTIRMELRRDATDAEKSSMANTGMSLQDVREKYFAALFNERATYNPSFPISAGKRVQVVSLNVTPDDVARQLQVITTECPQVSRISFEVPQMATQVQPTLHSSASGPSLPIIVYPGVVSGIPTANLRMAGMPLGTFDDGKIVVLGDGGERRPVDLTGTSNKQTVRNYSGLNTAIWSPFIETSTLEKPSQSRTFDSDRAGNQTTNGWYVWVREDSKNWTLESVADTVKRSGAIVKSIDGRKVRFTATDSQLKALKESGLFVKSDATSSTR
ncbi:MAG TPA: hypothetical protein PLY87_07280 [Planctomycetaceae bacterium]|nr:hypothetical protein [Planctomycetaceae bacterium]